MTYNIGKTVVDPGKILAGESLDNKMEGSDVPGWETSVAENPENISAQPSFDVPAKPEKFALYGFQIEIPENWRIEVNPKSTREKGDVAFHSPKKNRFFVSWGKLDIAKKRFTTLEQHRDSSVKRIKKGQDVKQVDIGQTFDAQISGHRVLFTEVKAEIRQGMFGRATYAREMWSAHLYCEKRDRFYVIYCLLRDPSEYEDYSKVFRSMANSFVDH